MGHVRPREQGSERMRCHVCTFSRATIRSGMPVSDHARNRTCGKQGPAGACILMMTTAQSMCRPSTSRQLAEPCTAIWSQRPSSGCGRQEPQAKARRCAGCAAQACARCSCCAPALPLAGLLTTCSRRIARSTSGRTAGRAPRRTRRRPRSRPPSPARPVPRVCLHARSARSRHACLALAVFQSNSPPLAVPGICRHARSAWSRLSCMALAGSVSTVRRPAWSAPARALWGGGCPNPSPARASIFARPAGALGRPRRWTWPSSRLRDARASLPAYSSRLASCWPACAVVNTCAELGLGSAIGLLCVAACAEAEPSHVAQSSAGSSTLGPWPRGAPAMCSTAVVDGCGTAGSSRARS